MNLLLAVRNLFKNPFVTVMAILSLGLGIGANAAVFSLFDQILLRNVPIRRRSKRKFSTILMTLTRINH